MPVCMHVSKDVLKVEDNVRVPGGGDIDDCELPEIGAEKKTQVLCKSSSSSKSLGCLSRHRHLCSCLLTFTFSGNITPKSLSDPSRLNLLPISRSVSGCKPVN